MITSHLEITHCPQCRYDIHLGVLAGCCPECGLRIDRLTYVIRPSRPVLLLLRSMLIPFFAFIILFPVFSGMLASIVPIAVAALVTTTALITLVALFIAALIRVRRETPSLVTSRECLTILRGTESQCIAWQDIASVNIRDWPIRINTTSGSEINLSRAFESNADLLKFELIAGILKSPATDGSDSREQELQAALDKLAASASTKPRKRRRNWIWYGLGYVAIVVIINVFVLPTNKRLAAGICAGLFWIVVIALLIQTWRSDTRKGADERAT